MWGWSFGPEAIGDKKGLFEPYLSAEAASFFPGQVRGSRVVAVHHHAVRDHVQQETGDRSEKPKAWKDVLDPKWKGKVAYADASKSGSSYTLLVTWLTIYGKNETGWKFVEDLLRQCKVLPSPA